MTAQSLQFKGLVKTVAGLILPSVNDPQVKNQPFMDWSVVETIRRIRQGSITPANSKVCTRKIYASRRHFLLRACCGDVALCDVIDCSVARLSFKKFEVSQLLIWIEDWGCVSYSSPRSTVVKNTVSCLLYANVLANWQKYTRYSMLGAVYNKAYRNFHGIAKEWKCSPTSSRLLFQNIWYFDKCSGEPQ